MATITQEVDITTAEGKQQASSGKSSLSLYLQQMGNRQREAFEKVYYATVDQPCSQPCMMTCDTDMDRFLIVCCLKMEHWCNVNFDCLATATHFFAFPFT